MPKLNSVDPLAELTATRTASPGHRQTRIDALPWNIRDEQSAIFKTESVRAYSPI